MQIKLKPDLAEACVDRKISPYIPQAVKEIILDGDYWVELESLQQDVRQFHVAEKILQGM